MNSSDLTQVQPLHRTADAGEALWWFETLAVIKTTAEETGGLMSILEITEPPRVEAPMHVHHDEDESFWILEGSATFEVGDTSFTARAGDFVFGPRDVPHRYATGDEGCRMLFIMTPGGFENAVRAMSRPAERRTLPPPMEAEPNWEEVAAVAQKHNLELLD